MVENFTRQTSLGMLWMLSSGLCFVTVIGLVRYLEGSLPAAEASFIRYLIGLVFFVPYLWKYSSKLFRRSNLLRYFIRSGFHSLGVVAWFFAMSKLPVAEVTAIGYMTPVFVTLGAVIVFKEKI
jgi:drug/metabolite transporter (DMT)-like permease